MDNNETGFLVQQACGKCGVRLRGIATPEDVGHIHAIEMSHKNPETGLECDGTASVLVGRPLPRPIEQ